MSLDDVMIPTQIEERHRLKQKVCQDSFLEASAKANMVELG